MAIGLSTYAFFWQWSNRVASPLSLEGMLQKTADLGVSVFQICDYPLIESLSADHLRDVRRQADDLGITLELGTRGVRPEHLARYLDLARVLGAATVRSMFNSADHRPTPDEAERMLRQALPGYEEAGVVLALETYEQVPSATLVDVVARIGSPSLGICSDPANCVAALETPTEVIGRVAPHVVNMHIKDFAFTRTEGWVGFILVGAPLGEGMLDYDGMLATVSAAAGDRMPRINQIIEHWLPWQGDAESTCRMEDDWNARNVRYLRSKEQ